MRGEGHIASMGQKRNTHKALMGKPEETTRKTYT
jgi:hypothetical protein